MKEADHSRWRLGWVRKCEGARGLNGQQDGVEKDRTENGDFCPPARKSDEP